MLSAWKSGLLLCLLLMEVIAVGQESDPAMVGTWWLMNTQWADTETREPPRDLKLVLAEDGTAIMESAIVSRSYRMTTEGCLVNETRRDALSFRGRYEGRGADLLFTWDEVQGEGREAFLAAYFQKWDDSAYRWPNPTDRFLEVALPDRTLIVERIDSPES